MLRLGACVSQSPDPIALVIRPRVREDHHASNEDKEEDKDAHDTNEDLDVHNYLRINAPSARIDGTHTPTKIPESLSAANQRNTEKQNERNAATRISTSGTSMPLRRVSIASDQFFDTGTPLDPRPPETAPIHGQY